MKNPLRGFSKIFSFTFCQHVKSKGYKSSTIMIALLCLLIPALAMFGIQSMAGGAATEEPPVDTAPETGESASLPAELEQIRQIYAVDLSEDGKVDLSSLPGFLYQGYGLSVSLTDYGDDFDRAAADAAGSADTLIVAAQNLGDEYTLHIVAPEESGLGYLTAQDFEPAVAAYADMLTAASSAAAGEGADEEMSVEESMETAVSLVLSFVILMVLYFFVLAYGQGVANSVVMEKSSKLMESFLISVSPSAMVLGKLLAITLAGLVQLFSWVISLAVSFAAGTAVVRSMDPDSDMMILQVFDFIGSLSGGVFTFSGCLMAVLLVIAGMLLYCSLAAIGGAMASKAEDLSSANIIFSLVLVASFLASLYAGGIMEGEGNPLLEWIPFTAVFVTPAKILMGQVPLWQSATIFLITAAATVIAALIAGKIYRSLALYRGDLLGPKKLLKTLRG